MIKKDLDKKLPHRKACETKGSDLINTKARIDSTREEDDNKE